MTVVGLLNMCDKCAELVVETETTRCGICGQACCPECVEYSQNRHEMVCVRHVEEDESTLCGTSTNRNMLVGKAG